MVDQYREAIIRQEEQKSREKLLSRFRGVKPGWIILAVFLMAIFINWFSQQGTINKYLPILLFGGAILLIILSQGSKEGGGWVYREDAESLILKRVRQEQQTPYSEVPEGEIIISHKGYPDYEKRTWFIPYFIYDKFTETREWFVGVVDCWGKGYLGSYQLGPDEQPDGTEGGFRYPPSTAKKEED